MQTENAISEVWSHSTTSLPCGRGSEKPLAPLPVLLRAMVEFAKSGRRRQASNELLAVGLFGRRSQIGNRIESLLRGRVSSPQVSPRRVSIGVASLVALAMAGTQLPRWIAFAQTARASFDVASVKPGDPDDPLRFRQPPGGRYLVSGASLRVLIADAWDVRDYQITGLPTWANSEKFSIEAKTNATIPAWPESNKLLAAMLQSLLADRFGLTLHRETHQDTIYNLVPAKSGFKLKPAAADAPGGFEMIPNQIHSLAVPLEYLAGGLATVLRRPVSDKTGIAGKYDYRLNYTPDDAPAPDPSVPTIFTALEQQLGLKLEAARGPVETVVIDHVEQLHAN